MRSNKHINVLGIVLLNVIYMVLVYNLRMHWSMLLCTPDGLGKPLDILLRGGVLEPLLAVVFCLGLVCGVIYFAKGLGIAPDKLLLRHGVVYLLGFLWAMMNLQIFSESHGNITLHSEEYHMAKMLFRIFSVDALLAAVICVAAAWLWRLAERQK